MALEHLTTEVLAQYIAEELEADGWGDVEPHLFEMVSEGNYTQDDDDHDDAEALRVVLGPRRRATQRNVPIEKEIEMKKKHGKVVTLRYIATADFRLSERTIFDEISKKRPELAKLSANSNEMIVVKSGSGRQWLAVFGWRDVEGFRGEKRRVLVSERHRLDGGTWSDVMIANYARDAGYRLRGLPTLEEIVAKLKRAVSFGGVS